MSIRNMISQPVRINEEIVEFGGKKYRLVGKPDAAAYADTILLKPDECAKLSRLWQTTLQVDPFDEELVSNIKAVHKTLQNEVWVEDDSEAGGHWEQDGDKYDEIEIAQLARQEGGLFLQLIGAAMKVLGIVDTDRKKAALDGFNQALVGNSETATP